MLYKLYSLQQDCTYSNYTGTAATYLASCGTEELLYKYCKNCTVCIRTNCTYSNYTTAAATCLAAQQHSIFTVRILYKLYSLQLNCTYSNYTEAAAICSAAHQHRKCQLMWMKWITACCLKFYAYINITALRNSYVCSCPVSAGGLYTFPS